MRKVKFEDVATRVNTREDKDNTSLLYYVGGDHIESGEMVVHNRGLIAGSTIGPMFYFGFKKGDILLVSRNPHLRKASMVNFDGICSEKTFVIGTKDESVLLQRYLAVVVQTDSFWNYCEEHKSGGVNFFVNWSTLAKYEFELPDIVEQRIISDKVWAAYEVKESYRKLISATDEIVKSRFIEMFGNLESKKRLGDVASYINGFAFKPSDWSTTGLPIIRIQNLTGTNEVFNYYDGDYPAQVEVNNGDILISWSATLGVYVWLEGKALLNQHIFKVSFDKGYINRGYFIYAVTQKLDEMSTKTHGTTMRHIVKSDFDNTIIPFPSIDQQDQFALIASQADKSKFNGFKSRFFAQFDLLPRDYKWKDVLAIINGKAYGEEYQEEGKYPICGSAGVMGYGNKKLCEHDTIILGRKGNIDKPIYMNEDYWIVDTAFCLLPKKDIIHPVYLYYWCKQFDFQKLNKQAVLPSLTRSDLEQIEIQVPKMEDQMMFVKVVQQADKSKYLS